MKNHTHIIFVLLIVVYSAYILVPIVPVYTPMIIRMLLCFIIWIYVFFNSAPRVVISSIIKLLPIYLLLVLRILVFAINTPGKLLYVTYDTLHLFTLSISVIYICHYFEKKEIRQISFVLLLLIAITSLTTYYGNLMFPNASRILATTGLQEDEISLYSRYNIGGFDFTYLIVLIIPIIIYAIKYRQLPLILAALLLVLIETTILKTEYTTAFISSIACLSLLFLPKKVNTAHLLIFGICFALFLWIATAVFSSILLRLSGSLESAQMQTRLNDIAAVLTGGNVSVNSDLEGRSDLWLTSLRVFFQYPFGTWSFSDTGHSFILDSLARYGIFGAISILIFINGMYKQYIQPYKTYDIYGYLVFYFIVYLVQLVVNPQPFIFAVTFIIPLLCMSFVEDDSQEHSSLRDTNYSQIANNVF